LKILIADDNKRVRELLKKLILFSIPKVEFVESTNGEEAVNNFFKEKPDLVLMDIAMKPMDGLQATRQILSVSPNAKIVVVTQLSENEYKQEAVEAGAIEFINKENLSVLTGIINKLMHNNIADNLI